MVMEGNESELPPMMPICYDWVVDSVSRFKLTNNAEETTRQRARNHANSASKWVIPSAGRFKINANAALAADGSKWGCGAIIRDKAVAFTTTTTTVERKGGDGLNSVSQLEVVVVLEGIKLAAAAMDIDHVVVEIDLLILAHYLSSSKTPISHLGSIISDIRFLTSQFSEISFSFVARGANMVAHRLAKHGLSLDSSCNWLEYAPDFIANVLIEDSIE